MSNDDEVGYGKPPKHTRFKKGKSGNPKGRPKGRRNFATDVRDMLDAPVEVKLNGRSKTVSTKTAALMRLREKALGGNDRSLAKLIELAATHDTEDGAEPAAAELAQKAQPLIARWEQRVLERDARRRAAEAAPSEDDDPPPDDDDACLC